MSEVKTIQKPYLGSEDVAFFVKNTEGDYFPEDDDSFYEDALCYQPTAHEDLKEMIDYLELNQDDVIVDLGCGKGRVVCLMALQDVKKVVGVELREEMVSIARNNVSKLRPKALVEINHDDCATFYSEDATIYYMFNAFGKDTVKRVLVNIKDSIKDNPRDIRIVYNNFVYGHLLDEADWLVKEGRIAGTSMCIWRNKAVSAIKETTRKKGDLW